MKPSLKVFTAATLVASTCSGWVQPASACISLPSPPPVLRLATPADLPANLTLNPGQRIEFVIPHPENLHIELVGDLKLLSRPGDAHLALGVAEDATHVDAQIRFLDPDPIYRRCTPAATSVRLVRQAIVLPTIREVDVNLSKAPGLAELGRRPVAIYGHDLLKVTVASDNTDVVVTANGRIWAPVRLAFDVEKRLFTAWFRDSGIRAKPVDQPLEITVKRLLDGSWQLEHFKLERRPTPLC